ncbi:MAG TPA: hypothetical protein VIF60_21130 [Burkholderiaceae bacterium]
MTHPKKPPEKKMTPTEQNAIVRPAFNDRRRKTQPAPPYLTDDGVVLVDRRGDKNTYTIFGRYTYRAWVEVAVGNVQGARCDAWYEIVSPDGKTVLHGPSKLDQQFLSEDEAYVAVAQKVKWDIFHMVGSQAGQLQ